MSRYTQPMDELAAVDASALPDLQQQAYFEQYGEQQPLTAEDVPSYLVPDQVADFLGFFYRQITQGNVGEVAQCYDHRFKQLTERYFKDAPWPEAHLVAPFVNNDSLFLTLYKELYFRHMYTTQSKTVTIEQRFESYENYCELFNQLIDTEEPVAIELPNKWLWDIVDEFVYQFQAFSQYRAKLSDKTPEEIDLLRSSPQIWNVHIVLNVLHSLINKSNVNEQLVEISRGEDPLDVAGVFGAHPLYRMLGYFSLVGLLRLQCLLGDYYEALTVIENIDLHKKGWYSTVPSCYVTLYYHVGFAYIMMRRYADAIRNVSTVLLYILRTQNYHQRSSGYDQLIRKKEQLLSLVALCLTLCPQRVDDTIADHLAKVEGVSERMMRMQSGDLQAFTELFKKVAPKFVSPAPPNYNVATGDFQNDATDLQLKLFLREIDQQSLVPTVRGYLRLYTTMSIEKLASFLNLDREECRIHLHAYKHKSTQGVWTGGDSLLEATQQAAGDLDFYVRDNMVHIADVKVIRGHSEYMIHQINKMTAKRE
eukprot:m.36058 g.36058  ORF g.36058 m.36058 type:complete len:536 (-) comp10984_c0_seq1:29-1636(-)